MVTLLITSFLLLTAIILALYRWHSRASDEQTEYTLPPAQTTLRGLFSEEPASRRGGSWSADAAVEERITALKARAAAGEKSALDEAHAALDPELYDSVLDALVQRALQAEASDKALLALASYITRKEGLRTNAALARAIIESWKRAPDRPLTAKMLHLAARSDDARVYSEAVELAFELWRDGRTGDLTAEELRALTDGEYWVLSQSVRSSGAGFVLKRKLAHVRRRLEEATEAGTR
jgi:hypothetical protein